MTYKYGSFTNFWHYNKLKIFGVVLAVAFVALIVSQCSFGETVDLGIVHISNEQNVTGENLLDDIKKNVDLKISGEKPAMEFNHIYMPDDFELAKSVGALDKVQVEITSGRSTLFILDKETFYSYKDEDIFFDLSQYAEKYEISKEECFVDSKGRITGISVDNNTCIKNANLDVREHYIGIRDHVASKKGEYENAFKALEYILENR
ncbi:MAG: hypothetical protein E7394_05715 [Ruminococcaceae bacterium]|nr:hypothetical protein [Oscillospiraceae bacterium]